MFKYLLLILTLITGVALAAGRLQNADFMTAAQITGAGGTVSQLLNTSKIFDSTNNQLLDTTLGSFQPALSSSAAVANQFVTGFTAPNTFTRAQPAFTDLSGSIATGQIPANVVSNSKLAQMAAHTFKGNNTASTADPIDLTATELTAELNTFTDLLKGLVPASGGGTTTFLRADGTFATPAGSGGTVTSVSVVSANGFAGSVANASSTPAITLSTSITGLLKGNGTAISAAVDGTDYLSVLSGDVTTSGNVATIANDAVTYAKMQNVSAASKLLGRGDSGSGDVQEITLGSGLAMTGTTLSATGGSASGEAMEKDITQASHGFAVGDVVYLNSTTYTKAKADADSTSEVIGVVSAVADANNFTLTTGGFVSGLSGLTAGSTYFLSPSTAGTTTTTEPTTSGQISKPIYVAASTTTAYVVQHRGAIIGSGGGGPYSWSGYHQGDCQWSTTSTSAADFSTDNTCSFSQLTNSNFGTVTSAVTSGNNTLPGINFTPPATGMYHIVVSTTAWNDNASTDGTQFELYDGTSTIGYYQFSETQGTAFERRPISMNAIYSATAGSPISLRFRGKSQTGSGFNVGASTSGGTPTTAIMWTIFKIN